jgi:hypothetical protein
MTDFSFNVDNINIGTEKQKAIGIYASFTLNFCVPGDGIVISLYDMKLRRRKNEDKWYIESNFREYTNKDGEKKKAYSARVWPDKSNWPKQEEIVKQVRQAVKEHVMNSGTANTGSPLTHSEPAAPQPAPSSAPW